MSVADTARALRATADLLDSIPGLPDSYVATYSNGGIDVQVRGEHADGSDGDARKAAVDMLLSVLGGKAQMSGQTYGGWGHLGEHVVNVYAPYVTKVAA